MRLTIVLFVVVFAVALGLRRGGGPERAVAIVIAVNGLVGLGKRLFVGQWSYAGLNPVVAPVDMLTFFALVWIALAANRLWPIFMASLQLIVISAHAAMLFYHGSRQVYWAMMAYAQYLQFLVMLIGIHAHIVRSRRIGRYRDWR